MKATEEAAGVFRIPVHNPFGQRTNAYLLRGDRVGLVDVGASHRRTWDDLVQGLAYLGFRPEAMEVIIATHGHADHDGLAHRFRSAEVLIGEEDLVKLADYQGHLARYEAAVRQALPRFGVTAEAAARVPAFFAALRTAGDDVPWARLLRDGDEILGFSPGFRVVNLPGHTEGLIGLYREADSILISSDQLLERTVPTPGLYFATEPLGHGLEDYRKSLLRLGGLKVGRVLPGHGAPFSGCAEAVVRLLEHYERRLTETWEALTRPLTVGELALKVFPECDAAESYYVFVTLVDCFAHLEVLRARGLVFRTEQEGVWRYERS